MGANANGALIDLRGEFVSVVGPSKSDRSTLLNMITGSDRPTAGDGNYALLNTPPVSYRLCPL